MKIRVDTNKCEAYGECVFAADDIFELGDGDGTVTVLNDSPGEDRRDAAEQAAAACPVEAITIED